METKLESVNYVINNEDGLDYIIIFTNNGSFRITIPEKTNGAVSLSVLERNDILNDFMATIKSNSINITNNDW